MPIKHEKAVPRIENKHVILALCTTLFETERGAKGSLNILRWIGYPANGGSSVFCYCAAISINRPGTNVWCGAINIQTQNLSDILPWITTTSEQCNEQLLLEDTRVIAEALEDLSKQFKKFLPTLQNEDAEIKESLSRLPVAA